jgi:hypothetical protein
MRAMAMFCLIFTYVELYHTSKQHDIQPPHVLSLKSQLPLTFRSELAVKLIPVA